MNGEETGIQVENTKIILSSYLPPNRAPGCARQGH